MFCPNCGTQNPDTSTTCSKCGFKLKGAAAPKFKGTMLMMNAPPGAPRPVGAPGGAPGAPGAPGMPPGGMPSPVRPQLKGTMLGVAPPPLGAAPAPPPPAAPDPNAAPPPPPAPGISAPTAAMPGFAPPGGADVNPLGGTVVAGPTPGAPYGAPGMPPGAAPGPGGPAAGPAYGAPGGGPGYGVPGGPPAQPASPYGTPTPAQPHPGAFPGAQPAAPPVDGAPNYGMQPAGQPGSAPAAMVAAPGAAMMPGTALSAAGTVGNVRNPIVVLLLGYVTCSIYWLIALWSMLGELKAFRGKDDINPILFFIPVLGLIQMWSLPAKVLEAKSMAGVPNPQVVHPILYLLLWPYFFSADLNEVFQSYGSRQLRP